MRSRSDIRARPSPKGPRAGASSRRATKRWKFRPSTTSKSPGGISPSAKLTKARRDRLQEIIDTYADFSRMDEVVFLMGEANFKLGKNEKAADFYNKLLKVYPDSEFAKKTRARLDELKVEPSQKTSNSKQ